MENKTNTSPKKDAKNAKAPAQNLVHGLFGRKVTAPPEPAPTACPSPTVDQAA